MVESGADVGLVIPDGLERLASVLHGKRVEVLGRQPVGGDLAPGGAGWSA
jgi:hypothetical protein